MNRKEQDKKIELFDAWTTTSHSQISLGVGTAKTDNLSAIMKNNTITYKQSIIKPPRTVQTKQNLSRMEEYKRSYGKK